MKFTKYVLGLAAAASIAIACSPTEEIDKLKDSIGIRINTELMNSYAYIKVYDVADGSVPSNAKMEVLSGNVANIFQVSGSSDLTLTRGRIGIGLHPRAFSGTEPVEVVVLFTADNCDSVTKTISFDPESSGVIDLNVPLFNRTNLPESVHSAETSATLTNGTLEEAMTLEVAPTASAAVAMDIVVPAGTQFKNDAGQILEGGSVSLNTVVFDATDNQVLKSAFPGGLFPDNIKVGNETVSGAFIPAGYASFEMTVGGQEATSFTQPVEVKTSIAPAFNPETGAKIKAGDALEIYSYDDSAAQWTYEGDATVVNGDNGLEVSYKASHFSTWSFGYVAPRCEEPLVLVLTNFVFEFAADVCEEYDTTSVYEAYLVSNLEGLEYDEVKVSDGCDEQYARTESSTQISLNTPNVSGGKITIKTVVDGLEIGSQQVEVPKRDCGTSGTLDVNLDVDTSLLNNQEFIQFNAVGLCEGKANYEFRPSFTVEYRLSGSGDLYTKLGNVKNGSFKSSLLKVGTAYDFYVLYDGTEYIKEGIVFDSNNYDFEFDVPADICATLP